jgi:hypothetical protein
MSDTISGLSIMATRMAGARGAVNDAIQCKIARLRWTHFCAKLPLPPPPPYYLYGGLRLPIYRLAGFTLSRAARIQSSDWHVCSPALPKHN